MYIVSRALKPVPAEEMDHFEQQHAISLPLSYRTWIEQYGEGTYTGWMNVQRPDTEVLKPWTPVVKKKAKSEIPAPKGPGEKEDEKKDEDKKVAKFRKK